MFFSRRAGDIFVPREDVSSVDFDTGAFTTDNLYHDLGLNEIIGINPKAVLMKVALKGPSLSTHCYLRTKGFSNEVNVVFIPLVLIDKLTTNEVWVYPNTSGIIEYRLSNIVWETIQLTIRGWLK